MKKKTDKIFVKCTESVMLSVPPCKCGSVLFYHKVLISVKRKQKKTCITNLYLSRKVRGY